MAFRPHDRVMWKSYTLQFGEVVCLTNDTATVSVWNGMEGVYQIAAVAIDDLYHDD